LTHSSSQEYVFEAEKWEISLLSVSAAGVRSGRAFMTPNMKFDRLRANAIFGVPNASARDKALERLPNAFV